MSGTNYETFLGRIVEKGRYDGENGTGDAVHHARVVLDVVDDAATEATVENLRDQLPTDGDWDEQFVLVDQDETTRPEEQRAE